MEATGKRRRVKSSRWTGAKTPEMVGGGIGRKGAIAVPAVVVVVSLVSGRVWEGGSVGGVAYLCRGIASISPW